MNLWVTHTVVETTITSEKPIPSVSMIENRSHRHTPGKHTATVSMVSGYAIPLQIGRLRETIKAKEVSGVFRRRKVIQQSVRRGTICNDFKGKECKVLSRLRSISLAVGLE
jgi:hypothetical protein